MARIRCIKPEFAQSQSMGQVSRDARLLFVELWTQCDDHGKARASPRMLASLLFPYDEDAPGLIEGWLGELERERCIERYSVAGQHYLRVVNWHHQKIDRRSQSRFPDPPDLSPDGSPDGSSDGSPDLDEAARALAEGSRPIRDRGEEGIEEGEATGGAAAPPGGTGGRARPLAKDWQPGEEDAAWARAARPDLDAAALAAETERFRLHAEANARTAHRWGASWRLWVSKAHPRNGEERKQIASDETLQWRARLKSYRPGRFWLEHDWGPRPEAPDTAVPAALLAEWRVALGAAPAG